MKISELIKDGVYVLKEKNIDDCNLKARLLLAYLLGKKKEYLRLHPNEQPKAYKVFDVIQTVSLILFLICIFIFLVCHIFASISPFACTYLIPVYFP